MNARLRTPSGRGLSPSEMATAATMASVSTSLVVVSSMLPHLGALALLSVVPFGIVAHRHGLRALIAALAAAILVAGLVAGLGSAFGLVVLAVLGGLVGQLKRRGRGVGAMWASAAILAPLAAGTLDLLLFAFSSYRSLVLQNIRSTVRGLASALHHLGPLGPLANPVERVGATITGHWALAAALIALLGTVAALFASWTIIGEILDRLRWVGGAQLSSRGAQLSSRGAQLSSRGAQLSSGSAPPSSHAREPEAPHQDPAPVPLDLRGVTFRYGEREALTDVDLHIPVGEFIAIVGDNGSGKSTLAHLLAGTQPSEGTLTRRGPAGLGQPGGTALIGQRPDAQVLGLKVRDDVTWGLPEDHAVDVEGLLATVGLAGMSARDTASLSGGQLQRLAVAGALAREPRLLISDESTAMVDPAGRVELVSLFAELPRRRPMSVVHITHNEDELGAADRVVRLEHGRLVSDARNPAPGRPAPSTEPVPQTASAQLQAATPMPAPDPTGDRLLLSHVGHSYAHGTVWEHRALTDVTLAAQAGEGLLVVGENGSGKSTLAWIMAGLIRPTAGACLLDQVPSHRARGAVGVAFQHARLQLQRPTVGAEIADAAGWPREAAELDPRVDAALRAVRLDPGLAENSIEELSGGQQRRVAIAGLLARRPRVLVLDEPLAGLDAPSREALIALLAELRLRDGLTLVVVTHDPEPLAQVCPRMIRLADGRVIEDSGAHRSPPLQRRAA